MASFSRSPANLPSSCYRTHMMYCCTFHLCCTLEWTAYCTEHPFRQAHTEIQHAAMYTILRTHLEPQSSETHLYSTHTHKSSHRPLLSTLPCIDPPHERCHSTLHLRKYNCRLQRGFILTGAPDAQRLPLPWRLQQPLPRQRCHSAPARRCARVPRLPACAELTSPARTTHHNRASTISLIC